MNSTTKTTIVSCLILLTACNSCKSRVTATLDSAPTLHMTNTPRVLPTAIVVESTPTLRITTTPRPSPTAIATENTPTRDAEHVESTPTSTEAQATATLPSTVGHISLSGYIGDAGYSYVFATSVVTVTWVDPPSACNRYDFILSDPSFDWTVIGTDFDPSDGVSIEWRAPEHLSYARLMGEAFCEVPSVIHSLEFVDLFSGDAPPEGVCVLTSGTMGDPYVYLEPSSSSKWFAILPSGKYVQVLERTQDGWYRIDTSSAVSLEEMQSEPEYGWISDMEGLRLFGPCDSVPIANGS
jgi:hypothetical protein